VIAHVQYVIVGGDAVWMFGAIYYWYPKGHGRMLTEDSGKLQFLLFRESDFTWTFDAMHIPGRAGAGRGAFTRSSRAAVWDSWNFIISIGAFIQGGRHDAVLWHLVVYIFKGPRAGNDPLGMA